MQANKFLETLSFSNIYLALFCNHHRYFVLGLIRQLTVSNSRVHVVSSAAVFWDVTQCSPLVVRRMPWNLQKANAQSIA